jgi:hypothetical protein
MFTNNRTLNTCIYHAITSTRGVGGACGGLYTLLTLRLPVEYSSTYSQHSQLCHLNNNNPNTEEIKLIEFTDLQTST